MVFKQRYVLNKLLHFHIQNKTMFLLICDVIPPQIIIHVQTKLDLDTTSNLVLSDVSGN